MAMPSPNYFVAMLFVFAGCMLLGGGMNLVENIEFWNEGQEATMTLSDPNHKRPSYTDDLSYTYRDIVMRSGAGDVELAQKMVPKTLAAQLDRGESIRVTYMRNNPKRIFFNGDAPESPWVYLAVGILFSGVAVFGLKLRKREAAA